ncbi:MAG: YfhO family protein, partial [Deltaproteobacteria bacterium]
MRIANLEPQRVVLDAQLESEGYVVFSDAFFPGWSATLDGAPVDIVPANVAVRAVRVPAGAHRIEMRYAPRSVRTGLWLAAASLALATALLARERSLARRAQASSS